MAFSLEAALAVPLAISGWLGMMNAAPIAYLQTRVAAVLEIKAVCWSSQSDALYETCSISSSHDTGQALACSPQKVLEISRCLGQNLELLQLQVGQPAVKDNQP